MKMRGLVVCAALAVAGCSSEGNVDIGDENAAKTGEKLSDYADVWEGYAEAYEFADGSDKVRITIDEEGNGTLIVGDSAEPAASVAPRPGADGLVPGYPYSLRGAAVSDSRLGFWAQSNEAFTPFCELQAPVVFDANSDPSAPETYSCLPNAASGADNGGSCWIQVQGEPKQYLDCAHIGACWNVCHCTSEACGITVFPPIDDLTYYFAKLDASLGDAGNSLVGTLLPTAELRLNVRLTRQ